jgi:hypothetical protein
MFALPLVLSCSTVTLTTAGDERRAVERVDETADAAGTRP